MTINQPLNFRSATMQDLEGIVDVHFNAFPDHFLTKLGRGFLLEMYAGFLNVSSGIILVAVTSNCVVGFAAGSSSPDVFFSRLRKDRFVYFLFHAIPALIRQPNLVIKKLIGAATYRGDKPDSVSDAALLSSLAVRVDYSGRHIGASLLKEFERVMEMSGENNIYLITDKIGNDKVNGFYKKNGYVIDAEFCNQPSRPMLRYIKRIAL